MIQRKEIEYFLRFKGIFINQFKSLDFLPHRPPNHIQVNAWRTVAR